MSAKRLRIAASLVLAHYVLALTVGGSFHLHGVQRPIAGTTQSGSCCSHDATESAGSRASDGAGRCAREDTATEGTRLASSGSEKCPVCQFLAQTPVPVRSLKAGACTELVDGWVSAHPVGPPDPISSTHPIRGPPLVA